ncbi:MAG: isoprenylcysteine carboxylmethyltransferase family protein [candidate division WOR-3 bacterium]|nr:isoprenylcysteine carboxylmethyltransferase family protein [candidate division WOR-3 bacterium]MCX7948096.1 isoprenylcysteine carboxylmethyltransferase family protein [candidate division WOR-3 bacterium]MDW8150826.1 isoprenylcysteine carboxylmethyltransferase family protein [candidate division WOR-3 bacterium]
MIKFIPITSLSISILLTYVLKNSLKFNFDKNIGIFFTVLGAILIILGLFTLLINKTTIIPGNKPKKLVKSGIFMFIRNPIYLGDIFLIIGISMYLKTLIGFLFAILFFFIVDKFVIPIEEKVLEISFKDEYIQYKSKVKRWGIF